MFTMGCAGDPLNHFTLPDYLVGVFERYMAWADIEDEPEFQTHARYKIAINVTSKQQEKFMNHFRELKEVVEHLNWIVKPWGGTYPHTLSEVPTLKDYEIYLVTEGDRYEAIRYFRHIGKKIEI